MYFVNARSLRRIVSPPVVPEAVHLRRPSELRQEGEGVQVAGETGIVPAPVEWLPLTRHWGGMATVVARVAAVKTAGVKCASPESSGWKAAQGLTMAARAAAKDA